MIKQVTLAEACANGEFTLVLAHNDGTLTSEDVIWNEDLMKAVVVDAQREDVISTYTYSHLEWVAEQGRNKVKFLINAEDLLEWEVNISEQVEVVPHVSASMAEFLNACERDLLCFREKTNDRY